MANHSYTLNIVADAVTLDRRVDADDYTVRVNTDGVSTVLFFVGEQATDDTIVVQVRIPATQSFFIRKDS
jgi:hypothetical protein